MQVKYFNNSHQKHKTQTREVKNITTEELNTALYDKMYNEQQAFKAWLLSQSPDEILSHSYEYAVREDILMELEVNELSAGRAKAMLNSPSPLADTFKSFEKMETMHMDDVWAAIENRADDMRKSIRARAEAR